MPNDSGKSEELYTVVLSVPEGDLSAVLGAVLGGSAKLILCRPRAESVNETLKASNSVAQAVETAKALVQITEAEKPVQTGKPSRFVGGKRSKGITANELILRILKDSGGQAYAHTFRSQFVARGFAGNSYGPALSKMRVAGKVRYLGDSLWVLAGETTIHKGAGA